MIEIARNLYVGNSLDYENEAKHKEWCVVQACKEPYHRLALDYAGLSAPRDHAEYLFAYRQNKDCRRLILNMVDAPNPAFFADAMIDEAMTFIGKSLECGFKTLVHCNQGVSRSPSLVMLYLHRADPVWQAMGFDDAEATMAALYPSYQPGKGIRAYMQQRWSLEKGSHASGDQGRA